MTSRSKTLRIAEAARSVFYIPILATVEAGFLAKEGYTGILGTEPGKGVDRFKQLNQGTVDVLGNAPTLNFLWLEQKLGGDMPVQVAAVNQRDGFFLIRRNAEKDFKWKDLEGAELVNIQFQPPAACFPAHVPVKGCRMLIWLRLRLLDDYADMASAAEAFRAGAGDVAHLQEPFASSLIEEGVGFLAVLGG